MWRFLSSSMVVHSAFNQPTNTPETAQPALSDNTHDAACSTKFKPKLCSELPVPESYSDNSPAFINIPHPHKISTGSSVCVQVAVPAAASNASLSYVTFPGTPWDSVLVDLVGQNTGISVPSNLPRYIARAVGKSSICQSAETWCRARILSIPQLQTK
ncbi:hypothetical protein BX667DRAFT_197325 [Coemansia mojavensis]|nr:hypothetical protein BX667DRAFT_197325 [Coemansia mojavensis]